MSAISSYNEHAFHQYHTCVLRKRTIPPGLDGTNIESFLGQLGSILAEDCRSTRLKHRERHDSPEHPWELEHLFEFKLFVLLCQLLLGSSIASSLVMAITILVEEPERCAGRIREQIHEHRGPKNPREVSSFLYLVSIFLPS